MAKPPPLPYTRIDYTPGRSEANPVILNETLAPRPASTPPPLDRRQIAPLRPSMRADLMTPEERAKFQQEQSNYVDSDTKLARKIATLTTSVAGWVASNLPGVPEGIALKDLVREGVVAATSDDPLREGARAVGRRAGGYVAARAIRFVGRKMKGKRGDSDVEVESPEGSADEPVPLTDMVVGKAVDWVTAKSERYGEHVGETLVDTYRDPTVPLEGMRDAQGRFRPLTALELGLNRLKREDATWFRRAVFTLGNETGQFARGGLELLGLPAPSEGTVAATAYAASGFHPWAGNLTKATSPLQTIRQARELGDQIDRSDRDNSEKIVKAIEAQTTVLRQMGARPTASQAYAE